MMLSLRGYLYVIECTSKLALTGQMFYRVRKWMTNHVVSSLIIVLSCFIVSSNVIPTKLILFLHPNFAFISRVQNHLDLENFGWIHNHGVGVTNVTTDMYKVLILHHRTRLQYKSCHNFSVIE